MTRVRFAPSPTGNLHIGGARTALFNWMYARSQGGEFVLRIEDTDRVRSKPEYVEDILDGLRWLKLDWKAICFQSQRFDAYKQYAANLMKDGKAYKEGEAVILKISQGFRDIRILDLIRGEICFDITTIKDQVLIKSDGSPTYSFACVVDDAAMEITHVIRGEDHISNTPKQILIYEALGFRVPKFAHLPLIMDQEGGRMSKRTGATAVTDYRKMGFLPEAVVNYLMLLGWSPGKNQEVIGMEEAIKVFSLKKVNKAAAIFSMEKLRWMNAQYLKGMKTQALRDLLVPLLKERGFLDGNPDQNRLDEMVEAFKGRLVTLTDFLDWTGFIFKDELVIAADLKEKFLSKDLSKEFQLLKERLGHLKDFTKASCEEAFRNLTAELNMKTADLVHPVRVALTGNPVGPGLFETMAILGKEKTLKRLSGAIQSLWVKGGAA